MLNRSDPQNKIRSGSEVFEEMLRRTMYPVGFLREVVRETSLVKAGMKLTPCFVDTCVAVPGSTGRRVFPSLA